MKTHLINDLIYHEDEGNEVFVGTLKECEEFMDKQRTFAYELRPLSKAELRVHNPELLAKSGRFYHSTGGIDVEIWDTMTMIERLKHLGVIVNK